MKICHVLWGLTYGGIETMVVNIANEQAALGNDVHIFVVNDKVDEPLLALAGNGVHIHCLGRKVGSHNPLPVIRMNMYFLGKRFDVLHFHNVNLYRWVAPFVRRKWCVTHHTDYIPGLEKSLPYCRHVYTISNMAKREVLEKTGVDTEVVLNGIDSRRFLKKTDYYRGGRRFKIVQVGRLNKDIKGQHILVAAARILCDKGADISVDFIGAGESKTELEKMTIDLGLEKVVKFLGPKEPTYIWNNLKDYDLLVQPSFLEGFGLTIAEGMAAGVPVLVSDVRPQLEVIGHGECGYSFKTGDPDSCANAILAIMDSYDTSIADKAMNRVLTHYDVRVTASEYIRKYTEL